MLKTSRDRLQNLIDNKVREGDQVIVKNKFGKEHKVTISKIKLNHKRLSSWQTKSGMGETDIYNLIIQFKEMGYRKEKVIKNLENTKRRKKLTKKYKQYKNKLKGGD